jgi:hypothetical protein
MKGPKIGLLKYSQTSDGSLQLSITFGGVDPNTQYAVDLACGPSHDQACGFAQVGTITTNGSGAGSGNFTVPVATLNGSPQRRDARAEGGAVLCRTAPPCFRQS